METEADIDAWRGRLFAHLESLGKKVYILVDMAGLKISPAVSSLYGAVAGEVAQRFALGIIRYNSDDEQSTTTTVRIEAVVNRFPSNIFPDRASAEAALEELRRIEPVTSQA